MLLAGDSLSEDAYVPATSSPPGCASTAKLASAGFGLATWVVPSMRWIRTNTSVRVALSPAIAMVCPTSPPGHSTDQRSMNALLLKSACESPSFLQFAGNST
jgi:hypothetical protein